MNYKAFNQPSADRPGFFRPKEGENRIRIVSEAAQFQSEFGKTRYVCHIIDRADNKLKPFTFGPQVASGIGALAVSSEYGFDGLPPYDMLVNRTGSGMDTEYTVTGARTNSSLTQEEEADIKKLNDIEKLAHKLGEKALEKVKDEVDIPVINEDPTAKTDLDLPF